MKKLEDLFGVKKPLIGMIHLAGRNFEDRVKRAIEEIDTFSQEGINGAIVEDYHTGDLRVMEKVLKEVANKSHLNLLLGVNILQNSLRSFDFASTYGLKFIQMDYVSGVYENGSRTQGLDSKHYERLRGNHSEVLVLGGVWPKYYIPLEGPKSWKDYDKGIHSGKLKEDIDDAVKRANVIVVSGEETGKETPLDKILEFRRIIEGRVPLIVGAGLNLKNAYEQLFACDGAIVGSCLKQKNQTGERLDIPRIRELVKIVEGVRT